MASLQGPITLTIPSGGTDTSTRLDANALRNARCISISAPGALTGTVTVYAAHEDSDSATFKAVQSPPGTDVTIAVDKVIVLTELPFLSLKLHSSGAEAADRSFTVVVDKGE